MTQPPASAPIGAPRDGNAFELLEWDSGFFGFATARILPDRLDTAGLEAVLAELHARGVRLAYWASDPADPECRRAAQACGGFLADLRLTYGLENPSARAGGGGEEEPLGTDKGETEDAVRPEKGGPGAMPWRVIPSRADLTEAELIPLALQSGKYSRFRTDPRFPPDLFRKLYEEWGRKSLDGTLAEEVLAARTGGELAGMVTVSYRRREGRIGLLAVSPRHGGRGLGAALLQAAGAWFAGRGCARVRVVTQGANAAARRLYEKSGYRAVKQEDVHHFWLPGRRGR